MTVDYETIETALGRRLRTSDNYNLDNAHFFPVGFLDRLFHFAQDMSVVEHRRDEKHEITSSGDDFDRWIDDMVATASVLVRREGSSEPVEAQLVDIASLTFGDGGEVTAEMADGSGAILMSDSSSPLMATSLDDLTVEVEQNYSRQSAPLETLEYLASVFYRASRSLKIDISNDNSTRFIEPVFKFFKFDLIPFVPDLLEDLEQIADEHLLSLKVVAR